MLGDPATVGAHTCNPALGGTHHPLALRARAEDQAAAKPSSSGHWVGAKVLGTADPRRADSTGRGPGRGRGRGQGRRGWRRARGAASGREPRRVGAGAWDATAGGFSFKRNTVLGKTFGIFFPFFFFPLCNVSSPAPWRSSEAQRFFLRGEEELRAKRGRPNPPVSPKRLFLKLTNFKKAQRSSAGALEGHI